MAARTQAGGPSSTRFVRAVSEELTKFERCEREFRKKDRDERAKGLQMPVERRLVRSKAVKSDS
jgi:hypothetical protein